MPTTEDIAHGVLRGDRRSIAKAITITENNPAESQRLIAAIFPDTGRAHVIGITGAGGAGKSTLVEKLVREYRTRGKTVGVVAVDPTSPFTGGAFLGDRIRMQELSTDTGVFIRSMATRNYAGGIAKATKDAVRVLDAAGKDVIIVETVGAGQSEVEIIKVAQTIVLIHAPGLGDEIQAIKAGLMEIADVFVVNKADRENASKAAQDIQTMLLLDNTEKAWKKPVLKTIALTGEGVPELVEKMEEHMLFTEKDADRQKRLMRAEAELVDAIKEKTAASVISQLRKEGRFEELLEKILRREIDPASAAVRLLQDKSKRGIK